MGIAAVFSQFTPFCVQRFLISGGKLGNHRKFFPGNRPKAAVILDFRPRLGNRCKVMPVYDLLRASILDFRPKLANHCRVPPAASVAAANIRVQF